MLRVEICSSDVIKHESYFFQLDSRTARERQTLILSCTMYLYNYICIKGIIQQNLQKFLKLFKTLIARVFFNSRASHLRRHEYYHQRYTWAVQVCATMKDMVFKQLRDKVHKSGSLGLEQGIIFQETDQLVDNFSLDLSRLGKLGIANKNTKESNQQV